MKQHLEDEAELRQYLLGELALKERVLIEERLFLDDEYALHVKAVEDDLIDDYVYEELTSEEREKFETHFLEKPGGREDLRIAEALKHYIASETEAVDSAPVMPLIAANASAVSQPALLGRQSFLSSLFGHRPAVGFSLAAAALIILSFVVWVAVESVRRRDDSSQMQARDSAPTQTGTAELQQPASPSTSPINVERREELTKPAEGQGGRRDGMEDEGRYAAERPRQPPRRTRNSSPPLRQTPTQVVSFLLTPSGVVRGEGATNSVSISADVGTVILLLPLADKGDYNSYRATLLTGGRTIRNWPDLKPEIDAEFGRVVPLKIPANLLRQQSYQIKLSGSTGAGQTEHLSSHTFQVDRK
jgi:hypothetical protein